jgi:hypothetical protein
MEALRAAAKPVCLCPEIDLDQYDSRRVEHTASA